MQIIVSYLRNTMYKQFIIIKNQYVQISFWIISKVKPDQTTRNIDQTGDNTELI